MCKFERFRGLSDHDHFSGSCNVLYKCDGRWLRKMAEDRWSRCLGGEIDQLGQEIGSWI